MNKNILSIIEVQAFHHVGVRVSDLQSAVAFYQILGFKQQSDEYYSQFQTMGLSNQHGLHINLIVNAEEGWLNQHNILMDVDMKFPGFTHLAMLVDNLDDVIELVQQQGIVITEGPLVLNKRKIFFIRDPDGNVIEFDQLI